MMTLSLSWFVWFRGCLFCRFSNFRSSSFLYFILFSFHCRCSHFSVVPFADVSHFLHLTLGLFFHFHCFWVRGLLFAGAACRLKLFACLWSHSFPFRFIFLVFIAVAGTVIFHGAVVSSGRPVRLWSIRSRLLVSPSLIFLAVCRTVFGCCCLQWPVSSFVEPFNAHVYILEQLFMHAEFSSCLMAMTLSAMTPSCSRSMNLDATVHFPLFQFSISVLLHLSSSHFSFVSVFSSFSFHHVYSEQAVLRS